MSKILMMGMVTSDGIAPILEVMNNLKYDAEVTILTADHAHTRGTLHYQKGEVVHATTVSPAAEGIQALGQILKMASGSFKVTQTSEAPARTTLRGQHQQLLLEAFVEIDEGSPQAPGTPEYGGEEVVDPTSFITEDILGNLGALEAAPPVAVPTTDDQFWQHVLSLTTSTVGPAAEILLRNASSRVGASGRKVPVTQVNHFLSEVAAQVKAERRPTLEQKFRDLQSTVLGSPA